MTVRRFIKAMTPAVLRDYRLRWLVSRTRRRSSTRPVAEVFADAYSRRRWTTTDVHQAFSSGPGSSVDYAQPYCEWVLAFARENKITRLVDLGCGDFRVGKDLLAMGDFEYVGVDIVPALVAHNSTQFGSPKVRFACLNVIEDQLPNGELCLIRQVLQHLSNEEVRAVLQKCVAYPNVLITEHLYVGKGSRPNLDKPHGPDTRVYDRSGVFLNRPPFDLTTRTVLELPYADGEVLRSVLLENRP